MFSRKVHQPRRPAAGGTRRVTARPTTPTRRACVECLEGRDLLSKVPMGVPVSISAVPSIITDANIGPDKFRLDVYYSAATVGGTPKITFSPDVSTTLTPDYGFWIDSQYTHYRSVYNVFDANVYVPNVSVIVDSVWFRDVFTIHTGDPPEVVGVAPSVATVTDNNLGTAAFSVRIAFNEAMNTNVNPTVTFPPDVSNTLRYDPAQSWWTSDRTFVARYDVTDADANIPNISIGVTGARRVRERADGVQRREQLQHRHARPGCRPWPKWSARR